ncbi:MAG: hypothetical protein HON70_42865, partial [Lentisphaerae bacterium]|nr:hypothetical protein [Lentisphaerota bacterium]
GLDFAASTVGGVLSATATTGDIVDTGALTVTGASTFITGANGSDIILDNVANAFTGAVTLRADQGGAGAGTFNDITFVDSGAVKLDANADAAGDLFINAGTDGAVGGALSVTAGGDITDGVTLAVTGAATLVTKKDGGAVIRLDDAGSTFGAITARTLNAAGDTVVAGGIEITENADMDITLLETGAAAVQLTTAGDLGVAVADKVIGTAGLVIRPLGTAGTIGLGAGAAGTLALSVADVAGLKDGFTSITIGRSADGTGHVDANAMTFTDPVTLVGGSVAVTGLTAGADAVALTARSTNVTDGSADDTLDVTAGVLTISAVTGIGAAAADGDIETTVDTLIASTTTSGDIVIDETNAIILGSGGNGLATAGSDIVVVADGAITVSEEVNARSNGDVTLTATAGNVAINADVISTALAAGSLGDGTGTIAIDAQAGAITTDSTGTIKATGVGGTADLDAFTKIGDLANGNQILGATTPILVNVRDLDVTVDSETGVNDVGEVAIKDTRANGATALTVSGISTPNNGNAGWVWIESANNSISVSGGELGAAGIDSTDSLALIAGASADNVAYADTITAGTVRLEAAAGNVQQSAGNITGMTATNLILKSATAETLTAMNVSNIDIDILGGGDLSYTHTGAKNLTIMDLDDDNLGANSTQLGAGVGSDYALRMQAGNATIQMDDEAYTLYVGDTSGADVVDLRAAATGKELKLRLGNEADPQGVGGVEIRSAGYISGDGLDATTGGSLSLTGRVSQGGTLHATTGDTITLIGPSADITISGVDTRAANVTLSPGVGSDIIFADTAVFTVNAGGGQPGNLTMENADGILMESDGGAGPDASIVLDGNLLVQNVATFTMEDGTSITANGSASISATGAIALEDISVDANNDGDDDQLPVAGTPAVLNVTSTNGTIALNGLLDGGTNNTTTSLITADADNSGTGQITDGNAASLNADNIKDLTLVAGSNIGLADGIEGTVSRFSAQSAAGSIWYANTGGFEIANVNGIDGVSVVGGATPFIRVLAASPLTVNAPVSNAGGGNIDLAADGNAAADDLTINANVTATGGTGNINLYAGDTVNVNNAGVVVSAAGTGAVLLSAGTDYNGGGALANGTNAGQILMTSGSQITSQDGNITLRAPGDILQLSVINADSNTDATDGAVTITADYDGVGTGLSNNTGAIVDNLAGEPANNIVGGVVSLNAASGIGHGTGALDEAADIDIDAVSLSTANTTGGFVQIYEANDVALQSVDNQTGAGTIVLDAVGAITDNNDGNTVLTAGTLIVRADDGIGETAGNDDIQVDVDILDLRQTDVDTNDDGVVNITDTDGLQVYRIDQDADSNVTLATTAGPITVTNGQAGVAATTGTVALTVGGANNVLTVADPVGATSGAITLTADKMTFSDTITTTGIVTLQETTAGQLVKLGAADADGTLGLTDAELDFVNNASALRIGSTDAGNLSLEGGAAITPGTSMTTTSLITGGTVTQTAGSVMNETSLRITAAGAVTLTEANDVDNVAIDTSTGAIQFTDADGFSVADVDTASGIDTDDSTVTLISTTGGITVTDTLAANDIEATGNITATLVAEDAIFSISAGADVETSGGNVTVNADNMALTGTITATAGANQYVYLIPEDTGGSVEAIDLGGTGGAANTLGLTSAELSNVATDTLVIGDANSGAISVTADVTAPNVTNLHLISNSTVTGANATGGINVGGGAGNLAVEAAGTVNLNDLSNDAENVAITTTGGNITYVDADGFAVADVDGVFGIDANGMASTVTLSSTLGDVTVNNTSAASGNDIEATSNIGVTLSGNDATLTVAAGADVETSAGAITLTADEMNIAGTVTNTGRTVTLTSNTITDDIVIHGGAANVATAAGALELGDVELNQITAGTLNVGSAHQGEITSGRLAEGAVSTTFAAAIVLDATGDGGTVTFDDVSTTFANATSVTVNANEGIDVNQDITASLGTILLEGDSDNTDDGVAATDDAVTITDTPTITATAITLRGTSGGIYLDGAGTATLDTTSDGAVTIDDAVTAAGNPNLSIESQGAVTVAGININNGALNIDVDDNNGGAATGQFNGALSAGSITIDGGATANDILDFDGNVTSTTGAITIQNAAEVDIAAGRTFNAATNLLATANITLIDFSGAVGTNTMQAGGNVDLDAITDSADGGPAEVNIIGESVTLAAVTLDGDGDDTGVTLDIDLDGAADDGARVLTAAAAISAGTIEVDGQGSDDNMNFADTVTSTGGGITMQTAAIVDFNADVTAATALSIGTVATRVDLAAGVDLNAQNGNLYVYDTVAGILLSGASTTTNIVDQNGDAGTLRLAAVSATNNVNLTANAEGSIILDTVELNTGTLDVNLDNDNDSTETMTANQLDAGIITINGGTEVANDDNVTLNGTVTSDSTVVTFEDINILDLNANVQAQTDLTFTDIETRVDIASGVDLTAVAGDLTANTTDVASILLSGAGGTNTIEATAGLVDIDAPITDSADGGPVELNIIGETAITLGTITLDGDGDDTGVVLDIDLDGAANGGARTLSAEQAISAGTIEINGQGTNDAMNFANALTSTGGAITIDNAATVDFADTLADVTAATSLTIQNVATEIELGANVDLTAQAGNVD